ncbi:DUF4331 domain-containing protein [Acanthopleuribacter pedis]|uniref:DUF4331 domain-containing protein n=1 Tax=Acanthopleuribacter pedis TaxID=442870 RepID=A0A8J7QQ76_9BACT|nr:DUF4331 domain-containing protein [Acanthopleuribacter pedis]MBO1322150.1 DUF4331 domain-containing protein [Acanthopleuribacter pedis]
MSFPRKGIAVSTWTLTGFLLLLPILSASSHREAPHTLEIPKTDGTDFYMFRSYESGREDTITLIANYNPLQLPYGGPNYFLLDEDAVYEIHIDTNGDGIEDLTFQFNFANNLAENFTLPVGDGENVMNMAIPLVQIGALSAANNPNSGVLQVQESYTLDLISGDRRTGTRTAITNADGATTFSKPADNFGVKSIPDYAGYADSHIHTITLPNGDSGRVFVGQRQEGFVFNIGKGFDLLNLNPLGAVDAASSALQQVNITSLCLEIPISFLTQQGEPVIGAWTTASKRQNRVLLAEAVPVTNPFERNSSEGTTSFDNPDVEFGAWHQVSRLGMPLVNEVVIGLPDKNKFNFSEPKDDGQFAGYVTNPVFPELIEVLFSDAGAVAPNLFPREDLIQVFLTGIPGLNQPANGTAAEMLRLNTGIAPTPRAEQNTLGVLAGDNAGFPNGRRPGDDVVDAALRVVMGVLLDAEVAPTGSLPFTDGAAIDATMFQDRFPYLNPPVNGSDF